MPHSFSWLPLLLLGISGITSETYDKTLQEIVFFLAKIITFLAHTPLRVMEVFSLVKLNRLTFLDFAVQEQDNINVNKQKEINIKK